MPSADVLIVGGSGFVGGHLATRLRADGLNVVTLGQHRGDFAADVSDPAAVQRILAEVRPRIAVNLAAIAHRGRAARPDEYERVNHRGAINILNSSRNVGVGLHVYVSTALVYGDSASGRVTEDSPMRPRGQYARTKQLADAAYLQAARAGESAIVLRPPAIYSREWLVDVRKRAYVPGLRPPTLLRITGEPPAYSLCSVENMVGAIRAAVRGSLAPGAYNVADEVPYTQPTVSEAVGRIDGVNRQLRIPRMLGTLASRAAKLAPGPIGRGLQSNLDKLFVGFVLDTSKLAAAGVRCSSGLSLFVRGE